MAKKRAAPKPRRPQDLTLRNLRALRKAIAALERRVEALEQPRPPDPVPAVTSDA